MNPIIQKHPELLTVEHDQKVISPFVQEYLTHILDHYPALSKKSEIFEEIFSSAPDFNATFVKELTKLDQWTYTLAQQELVRLQLSHIANNYPVPALFARQFSDGMLLDLSKELDTTRFYQKLDLFAEKIQSLALPEPVTIDVSEIGNIPLLTIEDPYMQGKLDTLWTLDVSYNPGLSIKDVIAVWMINEARRQGKIHADTILVEGTSGNTGAAMAIVAKKYGLKIVLSIPDKMSTDKINRLRQLGAHVIVTPTNVDAFDPRSYYAVRDHVADTVHGWKAGQYDNPANSLAHEEVTGLHIWEQTQGQVTAVVATAGTCGTISGIGRYLKKQNKQIKIIAVDTVGSILYLLKAGYGIEETQQYARGYTIQGFGEDIHPHNLDVSVIDHFIRISDADGLSITRTLPMLGYVSGQSSGAAYAAVLTAIGQQLLTPSDKVMVVFPDTGIPYRKDVYSKLWLDQQGFIH